MMRALYTAASGMKGQQTNVDTIANNISNVNTVGYKTQSTQFKSLLYQTLQSTSTTANGATKPTSAQVGLGTRVSSINSIFTQGEITPSDSNSAVAVSQGSGFFGVQDANGEMQYTRNGDFVWAVDADGRSVLTNSMGYYVMDSNNKKITLGKGIPTDTVSIGSDGSIAYKDNTGAYVDTGVDIGLWQFQNPTGLEKTANSLYRETEASGQAMNESTAQGITRSTIAQGYLEASNVDVATEMVNLIIAQRAYELNSKAITTSDTMLEQANNLKR